MDELYNPDSVNYKYYEIIITGHFDQEWSEWFFGLDISENQDGTTTISGEVVDQAELYGLIRKIRDLGVTLLSVNIID